MPAHVMLHTGTPPPAPHPAGRVTHHNGGAHRLYTIAVCRLSTGSKFAVKLSVTAHLFEIPQVGLAPFLSIARHASRRHYLSPAPYSGVAIIALLVLHHRIAVRRSSKAETLVTVQAYGQHAAVRLHHLYRIRCRRHPLCSLSCRTLRAGQKQSNNQNLKQSSHNITIIDKHNTSTPLPNLTSSANVAIIPQTIPIPIKKLIPCLLSSPAN